MQRDENWYRELCTVYPYGLNDNVKGVGNVSSRTDDGLVVYELFNKQKRKFRNRTAHSKRRKVDSRVVETEVKNRMIPYKSLGFTFRFKTCFMNLPRNKLRVVVNVVEKLVLNGAIPTRILMLVRYLMDFRLKINVVTKAENSHRESTNKKYMNVMFHNKGVDMINLSRILNSKKVMAAVTNYLRGPPPIVSYTNNSRYNRKLVNGLNMDCGTAGMVCSSVARRARAEKN